MLQQPRPLVPFVMPKRSFRLPYVERVLALNPIAYWRCNETSGSVIADASGNGRSGTPSNVTLNGDTFLNGDPAPTYNGTNSIINIYSASLAAAFNGAAGSVMAWAKSTGWASGSTRGIVTFTANANNRSSIYRPTNANRVDARYAAGGVLLNRNNASISTLDWFHVVLTWDKAADQVIAYFDGVEILPPITGLGTWAGALGATTTNIGVFNAAGANHWDGSIAHVAVFNYALSPAQVADISQAA